MSTVLVSTHNVIYIPKFDPNTGKYIDQTPYIKYQRNCLVYECRCRAGSSFRGNNEYKQHIKSKTHRDFIDNYSKYFSEVDNQAEEIKSLRVDKERLARENKRLIRNIKDQEDTVKQYEARIREKTEVITKGCCD